MRPRISGFLGMWTCSCCGIYGYGSTAVDAYKHWLRLWIDHYREEFFLDATGADFLYQRVRSLLRI